MKKTLSLLSAMTFVGSMMPNVIAISNYQNQSENNIIYELKSPITKVTAFYFNDSGENTFTWTKKLSTRTKANFFNIRIKSNSKYWVEGHDFNYFSERFVVLLPARLSVNIPLEKNMQYEQAIAAKSFNGIIENYAVNSMSLKAASAKLILNLTYVDNVITAKFTAKSTVKNTSLFSWVKTQAIFYFTVSISEK